MNYKSFSNADLHVHSKYSDRPSEWFLRRIGAPESFVEPLNLYNHCKARGMDFVTISDHNSINGALEIAHLPGTFLSSELTTYFPEDRCKVHVLVSGITESQFTELNSLRENIYEFRDYMVENRIVHSVNHPLFSVNGKLTLSHFEKILVLFNCFEVLNGTRNQKSYQLLKAILENLTSDRIDLLSHNHNLIPVGPEPWKKVMLGGSDDHSGTYAASTWTQTPVAETPESFLEFVRQGEAQPAGKCGSSLKFANSLINIATQYVNHRFVSSTSNSSGSGVLGAMLQKLSTEPEPEPKRGKLNQMVRRLIESIVQKRRMKNWSQSERDLVNDLREIFSSFGYHQDNGMVKEHPHQRNFRLASKTAHELSFRFFKRFLRKVSEGSIISALESIAALSPVFLGVAPYLTSYKTLHKDDGLLHALAESFNLTERVQLKTGKKAWLTDTFDDVNGVAVTIRTLASLASQRNDNLHVITSLDTAPELDFPCHNFKPIGMFTVPEYPHQKLSFPPILDIIHHIESQGYDELLISTPGPVGLCGVLAARLFGIRVRGIYHTDFPRYIQEWTDDEAMEELAVNGMKWFYGQMTSIYAPTHAYIRELKKMGFSGHRLSVLPRGVDLTKFNPAFRDGHYWSLHGMNGCFKFIYVGRVSYEKNITVLMEAWRNLTQEGFQAELAIVGDGPHLKEIRKKYEHLPGLVFTGFLSGRELSKAYANADVLVFPSQTDTFGNVVLEAHASGLPAIVSDQGGPQEIVNAHQSGLVVDARDCQNLMQAMRHIISDSNRFMEMKKNALISARESDWGKVLDMLKTPQFVDTK